MHAIHSALKKQEGRLNELNVYPVPDGDTGTNMVRTIEAVLEEVWQNTYESPESAAKAVSRAALMGARGNAGVILSQILGGATDVLGEAEKLSPETVAEALAAASERAYSTVEEPQEGTILTVIREAAEAAQNAESVEGLIRAARKMAHASVERTPELLPALQEAGVVDAGGLGMAVMLDGLYAYLSGEEIGYEEPAERAVPDLASLAHSGEEAWGYCTQFVIMGFEGDEEEFEGHIRSIGSSVLVIPAGDLIRVHLHTQNPGKPLSYATNFGRLADISVEDMEAQVQARSKEEEPTRNLGLVTVTRGEGNRKLFESAGAVMVEGGQTQNPSAANLADAIRRARAEHVILLPNNKNVILAAEQARELVDSAVHVIPSTNIAAGLVATVEFDPEGEPEEVAERMSKALEGLSYAEITRSVRQTTAEGQDIPEGAYMSFLDGELVAVEESIEAAALKLAKKLAGGGAELLTLLHGEDLSEREAQEIAGKIEELALEVELHYGGQPLYPLLMAAE